MSLKPTIWVQNLANKQTVFALNGDAERPLASITKLITAMVVLDQQQDLAESITVDTPLEHEWPAGTYTREELMTAMLVSSDNTATDILTEHYPGGRQKCILDMNAKAANLGMKRTVFVDSTGFCEGSISRPRDIGKMLFWASQYDWIRQTSTKTTSTHNGIVINNTNKKLLEKYPNIIVGKTGRTEQSGYCVAFIIEHNTTKYAIVLMGLASSTEGADISSKIIGNRLI